MPTKKVCLDCEQPIQGRSDKKFCDDNCRTNFHNQSKQADERTLRQINAILKRNRSILIRLSASQQEIVSKQALLEANFNFHFCTHQEKKDKHTWTIVYDMAYVSQSEETVCIKRIVSEKISIEPAMWNLCTP